MKIFTTHSADGWTAYLASNALVYATAPTEGEARALVMKAVNLKKILTVRPKNWRAKRKTNFVHKAY